MHILYVDESGDDGFSNNGIYQLRQTPTPYYVRTGLAIHDWKWFSINRQIEEFKFSKKIPTSIELHATKILSGRDRIYISGKPKHVPNWYGKAFPKRKDRYDLLTDICNLIGNLHLSILYIVIDKSKIRTNVVDYKSLPKLRSWEFLIERYNLYLNGQTDTKGIIICDAITRTIESEHREFAKAIYAQSLHVQQVRFIESILFEPSESSNILQVADIAAFACGRKHNCGDSSLFDILKGRIFSYAGNIAGYGYKMWPD